MDTQYRGFIYRSDSILCFSIAKLISLALTHLRIVGSDREPHLSPSIQYCQFTMKFEGRCNWENQLEFYSVSAL